MRSRNIALRHYLFAAAAVSLLTLGSAMAAESGSPRIEDFDINLPAAEVAKSHAEYVRSTATQAYIWGIPAFLNFRQATEFKQGRQHLAPEQEPFGGWVLTRALSTPETNNALPNVDTLYGASYVRLDLQGPVVLEVPPIKERYFSVALLDAYFHNVEIIGSRTIGQAGARILIAPPQWAAAKPPGIDRVVVMPTPAITLLQRIYVKGRDDIPAVQAIQDQIRLSPLSRWGSADPDFPRIATPEYDLPNVRETRDPLTYFQLLSRYTAINPPREPLRSLMAQFNAVGLGPGALPPAEEAEQRAILEGAKSGQAILNARVSSGELRNGWQVPPSNAGQFSLIPLDNAAAQLTQIGLLPPDEAIYFFSTKDIEARSLDGRKHYTLTFAKGELPPVEQLGFWSLTMYRASTLFLVNNPIERHVIRPDTPGLAFNVDGSLTVHISAERPERVPEGNWLPAPPEPFQLALRTYLPQVAIRDGSWSPPGASEVMKQEE